MRKAVGAGAGDGRDGVQLSAVEDRDLALGHCRDPAAAGRGVVAGELDVVAVRLQQPGAARVRSRRPSAAPAAEGSEPSGTTFFAASAPPAVADQNDAEPEEGGGVAEASAPAARPVFIVIASQARSPEGRSASGARMTIGTAWPRPKAIPARSGLLMGSPTARDDPHQRPDAVGENEVVKPRPSRTP